VAVTIGACDQRPNNGRWSVRCYKASVGNASDGDAKKNHLVLQQIDCLFFIEMIAATGEAAAAAIDC
jgi:hypothetical protein